MIFGFVSSGELLIQAARDRISTLKNFTPYEGLHQVYILGAGHDDKVL
jgi:hypothetical protein